MASRAQSITVTVTAWNTSTNAPQANDAANVTLKVIKDGTESAPTNTPTNKSNGEIALVLTATEMTADTVVVSGSSSTANVVIIPVKIATEKLPTADPGASGGIPVLDSSLRVLADLKSILTTNLTETSSGYLAAGLKKFLDVAAPVFTLASVNQSGDGYARLGSPAGASIAVDIAANQAILASATYGNAALKTLIDTVNTSLGNGTYGLSALQVAIAALQTAINNISNNTSTRLVVAPVLELPDAGTVTFELDLLIMDENGNMEAPDSMPTVTAKNSSGTDRSSGLSALTNVSTGHYTLTYTLNSSDAVEQLIFTSNIVEGAVTRKAIASSTVTNADITGTATKVNAIYADYARRTGDYATVTNLSALALESSVQSTLTQATTAATQATGANSKASTLLTDLASAKSVIDASKLVIDAVKQVTDKFLFDASNFVKSAAQTVIDKTGYALTSADKENIAVRVESHLLDEGDSQMLVNAIVSAIGNTNIDQTILVAAIRADLERAGGNLNNVLARLTATRAGYLDNLANAPATPANISTSQAAIIAEIESLGTPLQATDYVSPNNDGITDAKTAAEAAQTAAEATQTNTTDLPGLIESSGGHKRFKATALEEGPSGEATISDEDKNDIAERTKAQTEAALNENTGIQRLQAVPGTPETPVFVIPASETPGLVNVLCRAGDFGVPRDGTAFTFKLASKQPFIGEEFQIRKQRTEKTTDGSCLVEIPSSATLAQRGVEPATYVVTVNRDVVGTVTVPETGGVLKMVNNTLIVEAAV